MKKASVLLSLLVSVLLVLCFAAPALADSWPPQPGEIDWPETSGDAAGGIPLSPDQLKGGGEAPTWSRTFDRGHGDNILNGCTFDSAGNVIVVGTASNDKPAPDDDLVVVKYSPTGELLWKWIRDMGTGNDTLMSVAIGAGDSIFATGIKGSGAGSGDVVTVGLSRDGKLLSGWPRLYDRTGLQDIGAGLVINPNGELVVSGGSADASGSLRAMLLKYRADGTRVSGWPRLYPSGATTNEYVGLGIDIDPSGNYIVAGARSTGTAIEAVLYKYSPDGKMASGWPKHYESGQSPNTDYWTSVQLDMDGNYAVCGYSMDADAPDMIFGRYRPNGTIISPPGVKIIENGNVVPLNSNQVAVAQSNCLLLAGTKFFSAANETEVAIYKYHPDGTAVEGWPYVRSGANQSFGTGVEVNRMGNIAASSVIGGPAIDIVGLTFTLDDAHPWYLAEGSTGKDYRGNFETWVLVQNPGERDAQVSITYQTPDGQVAGPDIDLEAKSRATVNVADVVPNQWSVSTLVTSDQPVIAERAVYWDATGVYRQSATDSIGVIAPNNRWYLAEGSTGGNDLGSFETWVLVQNPSPRAAEVKLTYQTPNGEVAGPSLDLEPGTRQTVNVADTVPNEWSVSTRVESGVPIVAERSVYWHDANDIYRKSATDSIGAPNPMKTWFLAEGSTGVQEAGYYETWVLVQNPGTKKAGVQLTYQTPAGEKPGPALSLEPGTRQTVNVADTVPEEFSVSTRVDSDQPVVCERAVYWNDATGGYRQAATDSIGVTSPGTVWDLAEGSTGGDENGFFETWVLVQNPGTKKADVKLAFQTPDGEVAGPGLALDPGTRQTVRVSDTVKDQWSVSTRVTSDQPVVCERAVYWSSASGVYNQAAHDSIGFDP